MPNLDDPELEEIKTVLKLYARFVHELYNTSVEEMNSMTGSSYEPIELRSVTSVIKSVARKINAYNIGHSIYPRTLDKGKFLCFIAAELYQEAKTATLIDTTLRPFESQPLFFGYFTVLDKAYCKGYPLNYIGLFTRLAENLNRFLQADQWLAPFTYFRAMEVALEFAAQRRAVGA